MADSCAFGVSNTLCERARQYSSHHHRTQKQRQPHTNQSQCCQYQQRQGQHLHLIPPDPWPARHCWESWAQHFAPGANSSSSSSLKKQVAVSDHAHRGRRTKSLKLLWLHASSSLSLPRLYNNFEETRTRAEGKKLVKVRRLVRGGAGISRNL